MATVYCSRSVLAVAQKLGIPGDVPDLWNFKQLLPLISANPEELEATRFRVSITIDGITELNDVVTSWTTVTRAIRYRLISVLSRKQLLSGEAMIPYVQVLHLAIAKCIEMNAIEDSADRLLSIHTIENLTDGLRGVSLNKFNALSAGEKTDILLQVLSYLPLCHLDDVIDCYSNRHGFFSVFATKIVPEIPPTPPIDPDTLRKFMDQAQPLRKRARMEE